LHSLGVEQFVGLGSASGGRHLKPGHDFAAQIEPASLPSKNILRIKNHETFCSPKRLMDK
jgi:hypothetical protein